MESKNNNNNNSEINNDILSQYDDVLKYLKKDNVFYLFAKRCFDIIVSSMALSVFWPFIVFIAIYIRVKSKNKTSLFKQIRIKRDRRNFVETLKNKEINNNDDNVKEGYYLCKKTNKLRKDNRKFNYYGQPFKFYKFQTMYPDARDRFPELYKYKYSDSQIKSIKFKIEDDPRVPDWALWLRKSSLDELPNFVNVLLGDMSIVGPRPDIMEMIQYYKPEQLLKLSIKPGVTGYAQVKGRGDLSFQDTLKWDLEYVKNRNLLLDFKIFFLTIASIIMRRGAF